MGTENKETKTSKRKKKTLSFSKSLKRKSTLFLLSAPKKALAKKQEEFS